MSVEINKGLYWDAGIGTENIEKDKEKIVKVFSDINKAQEEQSKRLETELKYIQDRNIRSLNQYSKSLTQGTKQVINDSLEGFKQQDTAYKRLFTNMQLHQSQMDKLRQAEKELNGLRKAGTLSQGDYNKQVAALRLQAYETEKAMKNLSVQINTISGSSTRQFKQQWDGLGNSISQVARELPAFTYSAQTGFMAISNNLPILADEIARVNQQNKLLNKQGQKGISVWRQVLSGMLSWQTALVVGVTLLTVYGKEVGNLIAQLFKGKKSFDEARKSAELLNKAFDHSSFKNAVKEVNDLRVNIDLAKKGMVDATGVIEQYNSSIGKAAGQVDNLRDAEKRLMDNANNYVQMMFYKSAADLASAEVSEKLYETAKQRFDLEQQLVKARENLAEQEQTGVEAFGVTSGIQIAKDQVKALELSIAELNKSSEKEVENLNKLFADLSQTAAGFNLDTFLKQGKSTPDNTLAKLKEDLQELVKIRETISIDKTSELAANEKAQIDLQAKIAKLEVKSIQQRQDREAKSANDILNERKKLMDQIVSLDREYARKSFAKDEEEIQALRDKFTKIREVVNDFNNDNPTYQIDLAGIVEIEKNAVKDLTYRQQTVHLKEELERQKAIFTEYEQYKKQFGITAAKEQFAAQIGEFDSYMEYIQRKTKENREAFDAVSTGTATGGQKERTVLLDTAQSKELSERQKWFNEQLAALKSYHKEREKLIEEHEEFKKEAIARGYAAEAQEATKAFEKRLAEINEAEAIDATGIKEFFSQVEKMSRKAAKDGVEKLIKELERLVSLPLEQGGVSKQFFDEMIDKLTTIQRNVDQEIPQALAKWSSELKGIAGSIGDVDSGFARLLNTTGDLLQATASIKTNIDAFKEAQEANGGKGDILGMVSAGTNIIGMVGSVVTSITGHFKNLKKAQQEARKAMEDFYHAAMNGELEYQRLTRERELASVARGKTAYQALIAQLDLLKSQAPELEAAYNKVFNALQGGEYSEGMGYRHGTWIRKAKTWDILASLAGSDYERLEKLYLEGKLTDAAKRDFESLRQLREELESLGLEVGDIQRQLGEMLTGTNVGGLAEGLVALFKNGKAAAADFGASFEEVMKNAITNSFRYRMLEEQLKPFYEDLSELMLAGTPTENDIEALRGRYVAIAQEEQKRWEMLEKLTGVNLSDSQTGQQARGLTGAIRREMTEETAGELTGLYRAMYDLQKAHNNTAFEHLQMGIRQVNHLNAIQINTANTVTRLDGVLGSLEGVSVRLDTIAKNTNTNSSKRPYTP